MVIFNHALLQKNTRTILAKLDLTGQFFLYGVLLTGKLVNLGKLAK